MIGVLMACHGLGVQQLRASASDGLVSGMVYMACTARPDIRVYRARHNTANKRTHTVGQDSTGEYCREIAQQMRADAEQEMWAVRHTK